jgi:mRNA-degrading endonuclease YafQ of YafQ-DinJ toxin-antitoxin module
MFEIVISKQFARQFKKLNPQLKEEVLDTLELLKNPANHQSLKVHKLNGRMSDKYSFSVNYKIRVIFSYPIPTEIFLLLVGSHDLYS